MSRLRPLLRLDDKVAAEGRRLQNIGGAPLRWVGPAALLAAAIAHAMLLLLPTVPVRATLPASAPVPDLPLVWRPIAPPAFPLLATVTPQTTTTPPAFTPPSSMRSEAAGAMHKLAIEPVAEPVPELAMSSLPVGLAAIVPDPDRPPPALDVGPSSGGVPDAPPDSAPTLIESVSPVYPSAARTLRAEGRVTLRLTILPDGRVGGVSVQNCSRKGLGFEAAAIDAAKRWRYVPSRDGGRPREAIVTVRFQKVGERP